MRPLILASASPIRGELLTRAGVRFAALPARIDEVGLRAGLEVEGASPRDVADTLAEYKARKIAGSRPGAVVIGCDQVLEFEGKILGKPQDVRSLRARLNQLSGKTHRLLSAVVLYDGLQPVWRHVSESRLTMRDLSESFLEGYLAGQEAELMQTVGGYAIEGTGIRLFTRIEGDYFGILGLPLVELLNVLQQRGDIPG